MKRPFFTLYLYLHAKCLGGKCAICISSNTISENLAGVSDARILYHLLQEPETLKVKVPEFLMLGSSSHVYCRVHTLDPQQGMFAIWE